jgi:hypothetical protein
VDRRQVDQGHALGVHPTDLAGEAERLGGVVERPVEVPGPAFDLGEVAQHDRPAGRRVVPAVQVEGLLVEVDGVGEPARRGGQKAQVDRLPGPPAELPVDGQGGAELVGGPVEPARLGVHPGGTALPGRYVGLLCERRGDQVRHIPGTAAAQRPVPDGLGPVRQRVDVPVRPAARGELQHQRDAATDGVGRRELGTVVADGQRQGHHRPGVRHLYTSFNDAGGVDPDTDCAAKY